MKRLFSYALIAMFLLGFIAARAEDGGEPLPCDVKRVGLDAAKFYIYVTQDTPYTSWQLWPGTKKFQPGQDPHGAFLTTYVNPAARQAIVNKEGMAYGSLIVTENFDTDKKPAGLMIMLKIKGYNPQAGDWYWFHYDARGKTLAAGRVSSCVDCHGSRPENDFLKTFERIKRTAKSD